MKSTEELVEKILTRLENKLPVWLTYHNAAHTRYVIDKVILIGKAEGVSEKELNLLKLAALFHDTGYLIDPKNHEEESCLIAATELADFGLSEQDFETIKNMIMATRLPQKPNTLLEKILADADLEYIGTDRFYETSEKLLQEIRHSRHDLTDEQWKQMQIAFLTKHKYFTRFCVENREPVKLHYLKELLASD